MSTFPNFKCRIFKFNLYKINITQNTKIRMQSLNSHTNIIVLILPLKTGLINVRLWKDDIERLSFLGFRCQLPENAVHMGIFVNGKRGRGGAAEVKRQRKKCRPDSLRKKCGCQVERQPRKHCIAIFGSKKFGPNKLLYLTNFLAELDHSIEHIFWTTFHIPAFLHINSKISNIANVKQWEVWEELETFAGEGFIAG